MNIISGFNLFVRQCLLYPLISPFLPSPEDVKKDVSYANGALLGTLEAVPPALVWQPIATYGLVNWADANTYAQHLEADGETVNASPQNIWRLPTDRELLTRLSDEFNTDIISPVVFQGNYDYWTSDSLPGLSTYAFYDSYYNGNIVGGKRLKTQAYNYVRCVKI
jgi:hypothetical protein